jgi:outer membrane protein OmpA-like peptidoglycan-associated protein
MFQAGYDSRRGSFEQAKTPCNCPADLTTGLSYLTIEPSLRVAPFKSDFYLYAGPRVAFNLAKSFTYELGINPAYPDQEPTPDVKGDFSDVNQILFSMQVGAGYDIYLSSKNKEWQSVLSPFVSFQPYFGQDPRSIETWNVTTVRVGAALKFGRGHKTETEVTTVKIVVADPKVKFTIDSPRNIADKRRVAETFPIRNYVFFDIGSTEIPDRYVLLTKDQVKKFREDQLEMYPPKNMSGRSQRQMTVYYNVLNILGDRMVRNPSATVRLTGASMEGTEDGKAMAESVKRYIVNTFGIDASRITTEGRIKPRIPSEQAGGTNELVLLREGDRRVSIASDSPAILNEFQTGSDITLAPVGLDNMQEAPLDSYVTFNVAGADMAYSSWSLEIKDENGAVQNFGPYTSEKISIPGKTILGDRSKGDYKVTMIGNMKSGKTEKKEAPLNIVLWTPPESEQGMRFSVIFEFNESQSIAIYEKFLTNIVTPKIPENGKVIIHGHTDIIGEEAYNLDLSLARANEVKVIIEKALAKAGRTDVKIEVYGFGEDQILAPFDNKYPEERFYNRTVIIDIIPNK